MRAQVRGRGIRRALAAVSVLLLTIGLSACAGAAWNLPDFDRAQVASDALPAELEDSVSSLKLDLTSSRLLGADSRGYDYFIVKSMANPSLTDLCLVYFVGSESSGVICSSNLPVTVTIKGLGTATLYPQPHGVSQSAEDEWVGDYLKIEPKRES